jgi:hypothetical protein
MDGILWNSGFVHRFSFIMLPRKPYLLNLESLEEEFSKENYILKMTIYAAKLNSRGRTS